MSPSNNLTKKSLAQPINLPKTQFDSTCSIGANFVPLKASTTLQYTMAERQKEYLDVLTPTGEKTGISKPRSRVHRDGDYHRGVHVWIYSESTGELLLQYRGDCRKWDISAAGHVSAGESSLFSAMRELKEELGISLPPDAFEPLFVFLQKLVLQNGAMINNEYSDVYLITTLAPIPMEAFTLEENKVLSVKYMRIDEYKSALSRGDEEYIPWKVDEPVGQLYTIIEERYLENIKSRSLILQKQFNRYVPVTVEAELEELPSGDREALAYILKASVVVDNIFHEQVWDSNPVLRGWLKERSNASSVDQLKWLYYSINKSPWSCLDENKAFLTTADSAVKLVPDATRPVLGWKGLAYKAAFPAIKPPGANFYPLDMDKKEFELWKCSLNEYEQKAAVGSFSIIRRHGRENRNNSNDLLIVPFSEAYKSYLEKASALLLKASELSNTSSLKLLLKAKADAFLSNNYHGSDISWRHLDSKLDVIIGPYESYEDALFGYKATFKAFVGIRDEIATSQVELVGELLQGFERILAMDCGYKSKSNNVSAAPRVIQLLFSAGDVKASQKVAFNLLNDECIVDERGRCTVLFKNIYEAKFKHILQPMAEVCINREQKQCIDFESFYMHMICRECCHGIGPQSKVLPNGQSLTVPLELQDAHLVLEEAKADIVGLWALKYIVDQGLIPKSYMKSTHISFLAGCLLSIRFGLKGAHGKGQALLFNYLCDKGAFVLHPDGTFSVDFTKIEAASESLSRVILTIQAVGDTVSAKSLIERYAKMTPLLTIALEKLEKVQVPVDIAPVFTLANNLLETTSRVKY